MNHLARQSTATVVPVHLPSDVPPTALSATLYDTSGVAVFSDQTISVVYHELTADAAAGDTSLAMTWGSARVLQRGDEATLTAAADPDMGAREAVLVEEPSSSGLTLRAGLMRAWATGARLYPRTVYVPLSATHTATTGRAYRIDLQVTMGSLPSGEQERHVTRLVDVVAHIPENSLTWGRLQNLAPNTFSELLGFFGRDEGGMEPVRRRAFEEVLRDVNRTLSPDLIISDEDLEPATLARLHWIMAQEGILLRQDTDRMGVITYYREEYRATLADVLAQLQWVDADADGVPDDDERRASLEPRIYADPF